MPFICSEKRRFHLVVRFFRTKMPGALGFSGFWSEEFVSNFEFRALLE